jgi:hypothetical protein
MSVWTDGLRYCLVCQCALTVSLGKLSKLTSISKTVSCYYVDCYVYHITSILKQSLSLVFTPHRLIMKKQNSRKPPQLHFIVIKSGRWINPKTRSSEVTCIIVEALWNWSNASYYRYWIKLTVYAVQFWLILWLMQSLWDVINRIFHGQIASNYHKLQSCVFKHRLRTNRIFRRVVNFSFYLKSLLNRIPAVISVQVSSFIREIHKQ